MKTLYVSDLDGTLLRSDAKTSAYTNQVINQLTSDGLLFSYATARSYLTATKAIRGLNAKIPIITYNGAVILQNDTFDIIAKNAFCQNEKEIVDKKLKLKEEMFLGDKTITINNPNSDSVTLTNGINKIKVIFPAFPYLAIWKKEMAPFICIEPWMNKSGCFKYYNNNPIYFYQELKILFKEKKYLYNKIKKKI